MIYIKIQIRMQETLNRVVELSFQLKFLNKLHHWNTTSYAKHKATDCLNSSLEELVDKFVEVFIGKYEVKPMVKKIRITDGDLSDAGFILYLKATVEFLNGLPNLESDLLNIRDELLAEINKTLYLLSLK